LLSESSHYIDGFLNAGKSGINRQLVIPVRCKNRFLLSRNLYAPTDNEHEKLNLAI
jgi:hypothetical protein